MIKVLGFVASAVILIGLLVIFLQDVTPGPAAAQFIGGFRTMMWDHRAVDLLGQMLVILAGTFGVLVLTKERIER